MSELKKIDLTCVVGKPILCTFWDNDLEPKPYLGFLNGILKEEDHSDSFWMHSELEGDKDIMHNCRILQDHWIYNHNSELMLPNGLEIEVKWDNGEYDKGRTIHNLSVQVSVNPTVYICLNNAIAVKPTGIAEGYSYG